MQNCIPSLSGPAAKEEPAPPTLMGRLACGLDMLLFGAGGPRTARRWPPRPRPCLMRQEDGAGIPTLQKSAGTVLVSPRARSRPRRGKLDSPWRRRRGRDVDIPWGRGAAAGARGTSVASDVAAAAATWKVRGGTRSRSRMGRTRERAEASPGRMGSRLRRGRDVESPLGETRSCRRHRPAGPAPERVRDVAVGHRERPEGSAEGLGRGSEGREAVPRVPLRGRRRLRLRVPALRPVLGARAHVPPLPF